MSNALVLVWVVAVTGCGGSSSTPDPDAGPDLDALSIRVISGDMQVAPIYSTLEPLVVRVENGRGEPASGVKVRFETRQPNDAVADASLVRTFVFADDDGLASTTLVLGDIDNATETERRTDVLATIDGTTVSATLQATAVELYPGHVNFTMGTPERVGIDADFNGDAKPDLYFVRGNTFTAALNTIPAGSQTPFFSDLVDVALTTTTSANAKNATLGDFNGDGKIDVGIALPLLGSVAVILNTTAAGAALPSFSITTHASSAATTGVNLATADVNGDGKPDLILPVSGTGGVDVFLNTTVAGSLSPTFDRSNVPFAANVTGCTTADVDGDGRIDLVVTTASAVLVSLNTTTTGAPIPSFAPAVEFQQGAALSGISTGDLSADGKPDLVVRLFGTIRVLTNLTPTGSTVIDFLATDVPTSPGSSQGAPLIIDVNQDGRPDVVTTAVSNNVDVVTIHYNRPVGVPLFSKNYLVSPSTGVPSQPSASDLDGDGRMDLAISNAAFNRMQILMQGLTR